MKKLLLVGLMMLSSFITFAQVSGVVLDSDTKSPLPGATVWVKDFKTLTGVVTDFDGKFSLESAVAGNTLVISYLGYETAEVSAINGISV